jgi:hypothetical protein
MSPAVGLPHIWWTNQEYSPLDIIPPWFSILIYHLGMSNRPVRGLHSEKLSHPIDMIKLKLKLKKTYKIVHDYHARIIFGIDNKFLKSVNDIETF